MVHIVIKPDPRRDLYVIWSTGVEAPIAWGDRADTQQWIADEHARRFPDIPHNSVTDPSLRMDRADATGTSAAGGYSFFGAWDYAGFVYEQRGVLPRVRLARACELLEQGREPEVWDLLEPIEDREGVRRG